MTDVIVQPAVIEPLLGPLYWLLGVWSQLMTGVARATGLEVLQYGFMHRAILVGLCIGVMAPLIGTFLVHRQLALIGDALAHTGFAGVAIGLFLNAVFEFGISPYLTAVIVAMVAALLIEVISETTDAYNDVSMAIVLSTGFALGTTLISINAGGLAVGVNQFLFGNLSTVSTDSAAILLVLFTIIVGVVGVTRNQLLYVTFDETAAAVSGLSVNWYNRIMVMLTAMVVVGAMQIMGVILVAAMLVVPVAGASQVARSFNESLLVSVVLAEIAVVLGIAVSYYGEATAGGVIVLLAVGVYVLAVLAGKLQTALTGTETPEMGAISPNSDPTTTDD
ncbi:MULTISPECIES: metal ABC transporter permease [Halobacterium]|uniref:metal ABC transporter permease n=1 Tax=Halobacterium TaxID=2239 RepID=UPI00196316A5|nr:MULTISPECIES: metal ABC transporter permease [Halobacterium]MCF2164939.1 metal ABC transporter permease [Halobacterium salinarum]MCF2168967.1 metal ABC transporter permease [Halobacterium salinarum]MCF2237691.1 metal ABC transporter permease [Halobacterium salinarum]QRY21683.1 metal ABC transporter permease [Halobacterium sp. GSL-19]WJK64878.1 metal ABC transporter permease [Halobacterium salinarum]